MLGVGGRFERIRSHKAEAARHTYTVGPNQILVLVITRIFVKPLRVPILRGGIVKGRIGEQAQADDPGSVSVKRTRREVLASRVQLDAGVVGLVLERIRWTIRA